MDDIGGRYVGYAFGAIGVLMFGFAWFLHDANTRLGGGETATGTVVEMRDDRTRAQSTRYNPRSNVDYRRPVIVFTTRAGKSVQFVALMGSFPEGIKVGDKIDVRYLPDDPRAAEITESTRLSDGVIVVAILGGACMVPVLFLVVLPMIQERRRAARGGKMSRRR